jgi:hypothetical protein
VASGLGALAKGSTKGSGLWRGGPHRSLMAHVLEGSARFDDRFERCEIRI